MKVIFLDVDGVLSTFLSRQASAGNKNELEKTAVNNLAYLLEKTKAKIILSSKNRKVPQLVSQLKRWLREHDLKIRFTDYTGESAKEGEKFPREKEIQNYLKDTNLKITRFVVLDAEDMFKLRGKSVTTDCTVGLTQADAEKAIDLLNN